MTSFVQSIGFLAAALTIISLISIEKKKVLILGILAGITWVTHLVLLQAYAFAALQAIMLIRNITTLYSPVAWHRKIVWVLNLTALGIVLYVPTAITIMIGAVVILGNWITFRLQGWAFRAGLLSIDITFLIANALVMSWGGMFSSVICLLLNIRAVYKHIQMRKNWKISPQIV